MTIRVTTEKETKEIKVSKIALTDLKIGDDLYFSDIKEISFNENDFIMQRVSAIKDCCIISFEETGNDIILSTYKG